MFLLYFQILNRAVTRAFLMNFKIF